MNDFPESVLILCNSIIDRDPRVLNQIQWLQEEGIGADVIGLGEKPKILKGEFIKLEQRLLPLRLTVYLFFWGKMRYFILVDSKLKHAMYELDLEKKYDFVLLNDLDFLPSIRNLKFLYPSRDLSDVKIKIHVDLHEYFYNYRTDVIRWVLFKRHTNWLLKKLPTVDFHSISTVSHDIAKLYAKRLNIQSVGVVGNFPTQVKIRPQAMSDSTQLIYHGNCERSKGVYIAADAIALLPSNFELHFMLTGNQNNIQKLRRHVLNGNATDRVFFHEKVPVGDIVEFISSFDLGLAIFDASKEENMRLAMPNKFFEYIQARLGVVTSSNVSMKSFCDKFSCGISIDEFTAEALALTLRNLTPKQIMSMKLGSDRAAEVSNSTLAKSNFMVNFS